MNTATRKIEITLTKGERKLLDDWSYACRRMSNIVMSRKFAFEKVKEFMSLTDEGKDLVEEFSKEKGKMTTTDLNFMYKEVSVDFASVPSVVRAALTRNLGETYKTKKAEIHKGMSALPTFKNNMPIPFNLNAKKKTNFFTKTKDGYSFDPFGSKFGLEFQTRLGRDNSNNESIIIQIMSGHFKLCDSSLLIDNRKMFLLLTFQSPSKTFKKDPKNVVAMNLGINVPVYVACTNKEHQQIGDKETFLHQRLSIQNSRKRLQKQAKYASGGKGRKKKLQGLDRFKKKERNFAKTMNHKFSHDIIKFAIANNASKIILEDLQGIARGDDRMSKWVLRNWTYFELQQFIKYKAKKYDIDVEVRKTYYDSQKCEKCGHTAEENLTDDLMMKCVNCGHKKQRDHNNCLNSLADYESSLNDKKKKTK